MSLQSYVNKKIVILTTDGRTLTGVLQSFDQLTNLVLSETVERIIRPEDDPEPSSEIAHGLYLVRGDNITIVGEINEEIDAQIDWTKVRGNVIGDLGSQDLKAAAGLAFAEVERLSQHRLTLTEDHEVKVNLATAGLCSHCMVGICHPLRYLVVGTASLDCEWRLTHEPAHSSRRA